MGFRNKVKGTTGMMRIDAILSFSLVGSPLPANGRLLE
jgi:hypothetical protein